jgi:probable F420-dependent oxidoreductase
VKFGFYLPTCAEGTFYPRGFVDLGWIADAVSQVEGAEFYEISASDYVSTGRRNRDESMPPPQYLEPLTILSWLAGKTTSVRLLPNVLVLPLREIVLLAKELTTLDHVSGGRLICGLGLGANRDEFEAIHPRRSGTDRGKLLNEGLDALRVLLTERSATFSGRYIEFADVELYPKTLQDSLPIYLTGDSEDACRRAARQADGWITFVPGLSKLGTLLEIIDEEARSVGRNRPSIAPMIGVAVGATDDEALASWEQSQFCAHLKRGRGGSNQDVAGPNLVGSPATIRASIDEYERLGVDQMTLIFTGNTTEEVSSQITRFIDEVMPELASTR